MTTALTLGDFERGDVETRESTLKARGLFFDVLINEKNEWLASLLAVCREDLLPKELHTPQTLRYCCHWGLATLLNQNSYFREISKEFIDTPIFAFYSFLETKKRSIRKWEQDESIEKLARIHDYERSKRRDALRRVVPNWKSLKKQSSASDLCKLIVAWAETYGLNEEWVLDFVIGILINFKVSCDTELVNYVIEEPTYHKSFACYQKYRHEVLESPRKVAHDVRWSQIWNDAFDNGSKLELPAFKYKWRSFQFPEVRWNPRTEKRAKFKNQVYETLYELKQRAKFAGEIAFDFSSDSARIFFLKNENQITQYCNEIEGWLPDLNEETVPRIRIGFEAGPAWYPSMESRSDFTKRAMDNLKESISTWAKINTDLKSVTKTHFEKALNAYLNMVTKSVPAEWVKAPKKNSGKKHFEWLVDYQVRPSKSYRRIAAENEVDLKTVREGVSRAAEILGLELRKPKRAGRPKKMTAENM